MIDSLLRFRHLRRYLPTQSTVAANAIQGLVVEPQQSRQSLVVPDILSRIFEFLAAATYFGVVGYLFNKQFRNRELAAKLIQGVRNDLRHIILVCKGWCVVGTELLYSNPLLLSIEEFRLLRRTFEGSPDLAALVKDISLMGFAWLKTTASDPLGIKLRQAKRSNADVFSIFAACNSLETMTISTPMTSSSVTFVSQGVATLFMEGTNISSRLRKLTIDGGACSASFSSFTLPVLEVLCLRFFLCTEGFSFPSLPRVHTLLLVETFSWIGNRPLVPPESLPSLHTIEVYDWKYCSDPYDKYVISPAAMQTVSLLGRSGDPGLFRSLSGSGALLNVQNLVVGVIEDSSHPFFQWEFPTSLTCLTVWLSLKPFIRHGMYMPASSDTFNALHRCLLLNAKRMNDGCLRCLQIIIPLDPSWEIAPLRMADIASTIDEIKVLCKTKNIIVEVNIQGE